MARSQSFARPKDMKKTLKQLFSYFGKYTFALVIVAILVMISALANLYGTYEIKDVINSSLDTSTDPTYLAKICVLVGLLYLCGVLASLGYTQIMARISQNIIYQMRKDMLSNMEKLPLSFFDTHSYGNIMSIFTNDIESVSDALNNAFGTIIQYFVEIIGTFVFIFVLDYKLSFIVMAFYILMIAYIIFSGKKSKKFYKKQQIALGQLDGYAEEIIRGEKTVKVFNYEEEAEKVFNKKSAELKEASIGAMTYSNTMVPMVMTLSYVNYAIVSIVGGILAMNGKMQLGNLASYLVFVRQTAMPINRFTGQMNVILNSLASGERVFAIINEKPEKDEGTISIVNCNISSEGQIEESKIRTGSWAFKEIGADNKPIYHLLEGDVRFKDVTFSYAKGHPVLKNISLYAKPGQKIAFVGSTGAGKTTITNLINRFYDIDEGLITIDGIDVKDIRKGDLRRSLGMVLQDTHLFNGTIEENIKFGKLDASHEEVVKASLLANADSFIRRLPQGYDTVLSSDGANLSQGQRQLLAIARAAISDPPILVLDEATSSIDTHTEKLIQEGMDKLMMGRTVFVIAHRLSTVRNSNAIIVLEHGQIIERGDHDVLMSQKGRYYMLCTGQAELA